MQKEMWRPVPAYDGMISASSHGRIRREYRRTAGGDLPELMLRQRPHYKRGYMIVQFTIDAKTHTALVHRLVLEAFVGPKPPGLQTLHADDDCTNNALSNLRWGTPTENMADQIARGRTFWQRDTGKRQNQHTKPRCEPLDPLAE